MTDSGFWKNTAPVIHDVTNMISLVSSILTFLLVSVLRYYRPYILNRVSLKFQGLLAFIDIIRHTILLGMTQPDNSGICVAIGFLGFYFDHLYIIGNVMIAINLDLLFFRRTRPTKIAEIVLLGVGIAFVTVLDSVPFIFSFYGRSEFGNCFISAEGQYRVFFKVLLLYVVQLAGMGYCFFVFASVSIYLCCGKFYIEYRVPDKTIMLYGEKINAREFLEKLYQRIALYPMASVVCFLPYIITCVLFDIMSSTPPWIGFISFFGVSFAGTANLIALMFDPHFQFSIKDVMKKGLNYSQVGKKELQVDEDYRVPEAPNEDQECLVELRGQENMELKDYIVYV